MESICFKCSYGCSLKADEDGPAQTWCSNDRFEPIKGYNLFPYIKECEDYKLYEPVKPTP